MIISDIKDVRATCKKFTNAQKLAWDDMSKWASREKNMALQETFHYLSELSDLWYEVQREFIGTCFKGLPSCIQVLCSVFRGPAW